MGCGVITKEHARERPRAAKDDAGKREKEKREERAAARETLYACPEYARGRVKYANEVLKACCTEIDAEGNVNGRAAQARPRRHSPHPRR